MNWEKILQLDAENLHKSLNLFFYGFLFYCFVTIVTSFNRFNEMVIPIRFKMNTAQKGIWQSSTSEMYTVTTSKHSRGELHIDTKGYPKELIISKLLDLLYLFFLGFAFLQIMGLSKSIVKKSPFEKANVSRLRKIGFSIIIVGFIHPLLTRYLTILAAKNVTISGLVLDTTKPMDLHYYILGMVFLLIAHVFKKGIELREENALTI